MPGVHDHLRRQLAVLRLCAAGPQRFADLQHGLGVPPSTLIRQLRAIIAVDLLRRDRDGRYTLGPGATALALDLLGSAFGTEVAMPAVTDLARQTGASAAFWRLEGRRLILLAKHEIPGGFHYLERFAHRIPESSVFGLALIAGLPTPERARHLRSASAEGRRLVAGLIADAAGNGGVLATTLRDEPYWRVAAAVVGDGVVLGAIGISRHAPPGAAVAARDRRCVAAAAKRLAQGT